MIHNLAQLKALCIECSQPIGNMEPDGVLNGLKRTMKFNNAVSPRTVLELIAHAERMQFLHSHNKDADGYEYGVAKVRFSNGQLSTFEWALSDHSDVDQAIKETS